MLNHKSFPPIKTKMHEGSIRPWKFTKVSKIGLYKLNIKDTQRVEPFRHHECLKVSRTADYPEIRSADVQIEFDNWFNIRADELV